MTRGLLFVVWVTLFSGIADVPCSGQDPDSIVDQLKAQERASDFASRRELYSQLIDDGRYVGSARQNVKLLNYFRQNIGGGRAVKAESEEYSSLKMYKASDSCLLYSLIPNVGLNSMRVRSRVRVNSGFVAPGDLWIFVDGQSSAQFQVDATTSNTRVTGRNTIALADAPTISATPLGLSQHNVNAINVGESNNIHIRATGTLNAVSGTGYLGACESHLRIGR